MFILVALLLTLSPLEEAFFTIKKVPECHTLLMQIENEGRISVVEAFNTPFEAQWSPDTRTVEVDVSKHTGMGHLITSIVFELHNALSNNRLEYLYTQASSKKIPREAFVRKIEQMEWKNWEAASLLLAKGRERGIFPQDAHLPTFKTFGNYLLIQKQMGHSQYHAQSYDLL